MAKVKIYKNGSYKVQINTKTGTKFLIGDKFEPDFPDSIDLKITQHCDWGCPFCYESSGPKGKHANIDTIKKIFEKFPNEPIEVAVGGGNALDHPKFTEIVNFLKSKEFIVNLTVNYKDIPRLTPEVLKNISGLGISIGQGEHPETIPKDIQIVYHVIAGITPIDRIKELLEDNQRVLILGYKNMGKAKTNKIPDMKKLEQFIKTWLHSSESGILVMDNLAASQLNIKGALLQKDWEDLWMGPEFSHSMFVNAVEGKFYPSSTARGNGVSCSEIEIIDYFKRNHVKNINEI